MASEEEKMLELIEECINNEKTAIKTYEELMELSKKDRIKGFIDTEYKHILMLKEIKISIRQILKK